jgi:hypothetical protein
VRAVVVVVTVTVVQLALSGCFCFDHDHGKCHSDENCARSASDGRGHCVFGQCQECAANTHCAQDMSCQRGRCVEANANVLYKAGAFHHDTPSLNARDVQAHEAVGETIADFCQGPRDVVETCARQATGCVPLPVPHAWEPCYGSGALCSEPYRRDALARMMANPPQCFCSCGPEHAAAHARHEELMRDPPP